jgi:glycosyltransferase involved in cell wall biosynthesis
MVAQQSNHQRIPGLVSVVIPAFNAEKSLRRAIKSALGQTHCPLEIIVINDGSTDGTQAIAESFGDRVRCISQTNQGETAARNRGFALARGEFVTLLDHDDWWEPQFAEACVDFLREHSEAVAVSVGQEHQSALREGSTVRPAFLTAESGARADSQVIEHFFDFWHEHDHICAGSAMMRASLLDAAGGQRTDLVLSGDMEYWAYLATFGKWGFIPRVLLHVDGTQVPKGKLYEKFHNRYRRCATVEAWEQRILPRLTPNDRAGFEKVRGRVAGGYVFAKVFAGRDRDAMTEAQAYAKDLEGKFGRLWRLGLTAGPVSWAPLCRLVRLRTRIQYYVAEHRR